MSTQEASRILHLHVALQAGLEEIAERTDDGDQRSECDRVAHAHEMVMRRRFVQRDEGDEHGRRGAEEKSFPGLSGREGRCHAVPPDQMAREERGDVAGEDREQHREHCEASVPRNGAEQEHVRESEPDPPGAEDRRRDRNGRRLPRVSDPVQEERETDRREEACDRPFGPAELRAEQREKGSDVRGKHERPQASDQQAVPGGRVRV